MAANAALPTISFQVGRNISTTSPETTSPPKCALTALGAKLRTVSLEHGWTNVTGVVTEVSPSHCVVSGISKFLNLGDYVEIASIGGMQVGEVIRVDRHIAIVKPIDQSVQIGIGASVRHKRRPTLRPDEAWKGRVIDALGRPIDNGGPLQSGDHTVTIDRAAPAAMTRNRVESPLKTGVRIIDLFTPICAGQRIGIFAGSGVGKSTLLAMLARSPDFDTTVIALVGERGREVREFIEDVLAEKRENTVTVVASGDESPMKRKLAPMTAMSIAEYFRDKGQRVLLIVDSITRFAHAARDIALAAGELPVSRGYTPSVFSELPRLLERAGTAESDTGSITGIFSVLVDGDDHNDPVADSIRGTLDGHIVLDREIADQARYPAINVQKSISRLAEKVWSEDERNAILSLRSLIARYEDTKDIRLMGGYETGNDPETDKAVQLVPNLYQILNQALSDPPSFEPFQDVAAALSR